MNPPSSASVRPGGFRFWLAGGALALTFQACGGPPGGAPGAGGPPGGGMPPAQVTAMTAEARALPMPFELTGRVEGSREVEVRARVSGILLERKYEEGSNVRKGQTLFVIDPAPYRAAVQAAKADVEEQKARLGRADRDVARLEPLVAARAASRKDYDNAVSDAEEARASLLSAQARLDAAQLDLGYTRVDAPISGRSSRAERSEGSLVGPGDASLLTRISQVQPIWVRFGASDQAMLQLRQGIASGKLTAPATDQLQIQLVLADGTVHPELGQVNFSDSQIDPTTGTVGLRAELPNATATLLPGQFVRVRLIGVERPAAILVPQRAVLQGPQGKFVMVVDEAGKAQFRPVTVGEWSGTDWVVESGVAAGDRVIVDGGIKAQPGSPVMVIDPNAPPTGGAPGGAPPGAGG